MSAVRGCRVVPAPLPARVVALSPTQLVLLGGRQNPDKRAQGTVALKASNWAWDDAETSPTVLNSPPTDSASNWAAGEPE